MREIGMEEFFDNYVSGFGPEEHYKLANFVQNYTKPPLFKTFDEVRSFFNTKIHPFILDTARAYGCTNMLSVESALQSILILLEEYFSDYPNAILNNEFLPEKKMKAFEKKLKKLFKKLRKDKKCFYHRTGFTCFCDEKE